MNYNLLVTTLNRLPAMAHLMIARTMHPIIIDFHFQSENGINLNLDLIRVLFDGDNFRVTTSKGEDLSIDNEVTQQLISYALPVINDLEISNLTGAELSEISELALNAFTRSIFDDFYGDKHPYPVNFRGRDYSVLMIRNGDKAWEASAVSRIIVPPTE